MCKDNKILSVIIMMVIMLNLNTVIYFISIFKGCFFFYLINISDFNYLKL